MSEPTYDLVKVSEVTVGTELEDYGTVAKVGFMAEMMKSGWKFTMTDGSVHSFSLGNKKLIRVIR